jgi:hypothetical protein
MELTIKIKATQWFKKGDHPLVHVEAPIAIRVNDLMYPKNLFPLPRFWMSVDKKEPLAAEQLVGNGAITPLVVYFDNKAYARLIYPFNLWSIKGEKIKEPLEDDDPLLQDYLIASKLLYEPLESFYGNLERPDVNGRVCVFPGNWIVERHGNVEIMSDDEFQKFANV